MSDTSESVAPSRSQLIAMRYGRGIFGFQPKKLINLLDDPNIVYYGDDEDSGDDTMENTMIAESAGF